MSNSINSPSWLQRPIKGVLLDIYGVIINSADDGVQIIKGSINAVKKLKEASIPVRFCTNESQLSQKQIFERLSSIGLPVKLGEVFSPVPAALRHLKSNQLRPYLIVHDDVIECFSHIEQTKPNCVVIGDAANNFSYQALNEAFNILLKHPKLVAMGYGKYYKHGDELALDVGSYSRLLEYACGGNIQPVIIGKPAKEYFLSAVEDMNLLPENCVMIGDDIVGDIGGAQASGLRGVQVRSGKYRKSTDEPHASVCPDAYVNSLEEVVDEIIAFHGK